MKNKAEVVKKMVMLGRAGGETRETLASRLSTQTDPALLTEALEETFSLSDEKFKEFTEKLRRILPT